MPKQNKEENEQPAEELNQDAVKTNDENKKRKHEEEDCELVSFDQMGLDERLLLSIVNMGWYEPTPIQEAAIPLIIEGRDILAKARTGSGKTGAYAIPLINKILNMKRKVSSKQSTVALIITPSKELCLQTTNTLNELLRFCQREISVVDISKDVPFEIQK